jgi:protein-tyrosine phosphatase
MSQILSNIYLGGYDKAVDKAWLKRNKITHILNCTREHPNYFPKDFLYMKLNLRDSIDQSIYEALEPSYGFIKRGTERGKRVYIHCHAGVSRSSSMLIYYLMKSRKTNYVDALTLVRDKRNIVRPNMSFSRQLVSVSPQSKDVFGSERTKREDGSSRRSSLRNQKRRVYG